MISKALQFTRDVMDQFLRNQFSSDERKVELNRLVDADGTIPGINQNKLMLTLLNIEKETSQPFNIRNARLPNGKFADFTNGLRFNLYIMLSTNFDNYVEGLKFLNEGIMFFQLHSVLNKQVYPDIPKGLDKLEFEIEKMNYQQLHGLWTSMGAKYQPSVIYKVKMITIQGSEITGFTPGVTGVTNEKSLI